MPAFNRKEQKLIDRLKAAGYPVYPEKSGVPFLFLIRPYATVGDASKALVHLLEEVMTKSVNQEVFESPISGIAIFPAIIDHKRVMHTKDFVSFKRRDNTVSVGYNIDFEEWENSSRDKKLELLVKNIRQSLEAIPHKYLLRSDSEKLFNILDAARLDILRKITPEE